MFTAYFTATRSNFFVIASRAAEHVEARLNNDVLGHLLAVNTLKIIG